MNQATIQISIDDQQLRLVRDGSIQRNYRISTAAKGVGSQPGSHRTPVGRFHIVEKIGAGAEPRTIFRSRRPVGVWDGADSSQDLVLSRILWLGGLDQENASTRDRFIYIHGTNHEERLGTPCSQGCVRMSNSDVIELFELTSPGTPVEILPPTRSRGKLVFLDCDSTLSSIEGIDELARARGEEAFAEVEALTNAAMNGEIPIEEVFPRRMDIIRPDRELCQQVAARYLETIVPGIPGAIDNLRRDGWTMVILSGGFAPLILPLAARLGIDHVEAVPLHLDLSGHYAGYDHNYPTTRNGGKPQIIREWKQAMLPERVIMIGDGVSDLEARSETDMFIGFGGVVRRDAVKQGADVWIEDMADFETLVIPKLRSRG